MVTFALEDDTLFADWVVSDLVDEACLDCIRRCHSIMAAGDTDIPCDFSGVDGTGASYCLGIDSDFEVRRSGSFECEEIGVRVVGARLE